MATSFSFGRSDPDRSINGMKKGFEETFETISKSTWNSTGYLTKAILTPGSVRVWVTAISPFFSTFFQI